MTEKLKILEKIIEFARANGFPQAEAMIWSGGDPEYAQSDIRDLVEQEGEPVVRAELGIDLGAAAYAAEVYDEARDEYAIIEFASRAEAEAFVTERTDD